MVKDIQELFVILFFAGIAVFSIFYIYSQCTYHRIEKKFSDVVLSKIFNQYKSTPANKEFFGFLTVANEEVTDFEFVGLKDLKTEKVEVINSNATKTNWTIHSHPSGLCFPSDKDRRSAHLCLEEFFCIVCGINRIECYGADL